MTKSVFFLVVLFISCLTISAGKTDTDPILGKWELIKTSSDSKQKAKRKNTDSKKNWIDFRENNVVLTGHGDKVEGNSEAWVYEADKKKLFITRRGDQSEFDVLRISKKRLVMRIKERERVITIYLKRWVEVD